MMPVVPSSLSPILRVLVLALVLGGLPAGSAFAQAPTTPPGVDGAPACRAQACFCLQLPEIDQVYRYGCAERTIPNAVSTRVSCQNAARTGTEIIAAPSRYTCLPAGTGACNPCRMPPIDPPCCGDVIRGVPDPDVPVLEAPDPEATDR